MLSSPLDPYMTTLLDDLLSQMQTCLGDTLIGLYLYGSLVTGDFDTESSDIDLAAALTDDLDAAQFAALNAMQDDFVRTNTAWEHRIEIAYVSRHALKTFKTQTHKMGIISPGEPFHIIDAGIDWLMNWYIVQARGVTLFGPPAHTLIDPISNREYVQAVKGYVELWQQRIGHLHSRPSQAYAILTLCRALYTVTTGGYTSKKQAAAWAAQELPDWAAPIQDALVWRHNWRDETVDHAATLPDTQRFVSMMIDKILL